MKKTAFSFTLITSIINLSLVLFFWIINFVNIFSYGFGVKDIPASTIVNCVFQIIIAGIFVFIGVMANKKAMYAKVALGFAVAFTFLNLFNFISGFIRNGFNYQLLLRTLSLIALSVTLWIDGFVTKIDPNTCDVNNKDKLDDVNSLDDDFFID